MDIVERLKVRNVPYGWVELADKAANEILRLRGEVSQMFSRQELETLKSLLVEKSMEMDDDGREGAFDASSLRPIYDKIRRELAIRPLC